MDDRRKQIIEYIKREFIGPDPIDKPGMLQENGEEILSSDPPRTRYIAGVLFPRKTQMEAVTDSNSDDDSADFTDVIETDEIKSETAAGSDAKEIDETEEIMNLSNAYQQSAISLTVAISKADSVSVIISAATYIKQKELNPETGKEQDKYYRHPIKWENNGMSVVLPEKDKPIQKYAITDNNEATSLEFDITFRYEKENTTVYTFTLQNTKETGEGGISDRDCFFQTEFTLFSNAGFCPMQDGERLIVNDPDYRSNQMMYRNIHSYAIGHGCAADWEETESGVKKISTSIFPLYEMKPVVPAVIPGVSLDMFKMSDYGSISETLNELHNLCAEYKKWIDSLAARLGEVSDQETANRHILNCRECYDRMIAGVKLLTDEPMVMHAFQLMNRAMLLQQLHYNLPLQKWSVSEKRQLDLTTSLSVLPDVKDQSTWYGDINRYGKWRPFQLAFILINLRSMFDRHCDERNIVDLIWFPTGGGKTEAYLGLSAYTIFIRRLMDKNNAGTTILMRYTLRLLTSQQYERASAMICACELIRAENPALFGDERISAGLWVGGDSTPNSMDEAIKSFDKLYGDKSTDLTSPFVMLKCPWCGAQMGLIKHGTSSHTPGYKKIKAGRKFKLIMLCSNTKLNCPFSQEKTPLPLFITDDDIYDSRPTLLLGTVDKFAMLPYRPEAQRIFGIINGQRVTAPDLIIQDELHLISGPLGSMVGLYETMIQELCSIRNGSKVTQPKVIASTATISRANEQCNALYACGANNVKQFPPSGLEAGNSFFAIEDKAAAGRQYVGILANASSSLATTTIRLYATLLYAANELDVENEAEKDGYWTNVGYFNSIRELGQTETWIRADISEYLHVIYKRRYADKEADYSKRRYIHSFEELTSRVDSDKIPAILQRLGNHYPNSADDNMPIDICLATNMISVGVDVPRLGLMTVSGQPKTTSEYIQATSRVGRDKSAPGLVFTVYSPGKPRDKSHYEHFQTYHSRIYCKVEPTSVTPFAGPVRDRALHAIVIGLIRQLSDRDYNTGVPVLPDASQIQYIKKLIAERINIIDSDELQAADEQIDQIIEKWKNWEPSKFSDFSGGEELPLMFPAGSIRNMQWGKERSFPTPMSMRSVDSSCEARVLENGYGSDMED